MVKGIIQGFDGILISYAVGKMSGGNLLPTFPAIQNHPFPAC
jgi:hypothetical protein